MGTLTTRVYDDTLNFWRESRKSKQYSKSKPEVQVFHGNSYFIRNTIEDLYYLPSIKYAYEDLYLSILVKDKGYYNGLNEDVYIIHKPLVNKWKPGSQSLFEIYVKANAAQMTIKTLLYPRFYKPLIYIGYLIRCYKTSHFKNHMLAKSFALYKEQIVGNRVNKVSNRTVKELISLFGLKETM